MDRLEFEDILKSLSEGKLKPNYIIELLETKQLNHLYHDELEQIALSFDSDDDKIAILKYTFEPIRIIRTLKSEESILKALGELETDKEKISVTTRFIKNESNRLKAIETFEDKNKAFPIKISLSREGFKKYFLREKDKQYHKIGLDKDITIGIEIESIGRNSEKILEVGESNGKTIHKEKKMECGKIVKRRKWRKWYVMDNYARW